MAGGTQIYSFAADEAKMRYREPYLTEGLNVKALALAPGVYRGFGLATSITDLTLTIVADTSSDDHLCVYEDLAGHSVTVRKASDFEINLASAASTTVYIAVFADYTLHSTTEANIRSYTQAEYDAAAEKDQLVILGKVVVPASGTIPTANISLNSRRSAFMQEHPEQRRWRQLVRNPYFDIGGYGIASTGFIVGCYRQLELQDITNWSLLLDEIDYVTEPGSIAAAWKAGSQDMTANFATNIGANVLPGTRLRLRIVYRIDNVPTGGTPYDGDAVVYIFSGPDGVQSLNFPAIPEQTVTSGWVVYDETVEVTTEHGWAYQLRVRMGRSVGGVSFPSADDVWFKVDSIELLVEPTGIDEARNDFMYLDARDLNLSSGSYDHQKDAHLTSVNEDSALPYPGTGSEDDLPSLHVSHAYGGYLAGGVFTGPVSAGSSMASGTYREWPRFYATYSTSQDYQLFYQGLIATSDVQRWAWWSGGDEGYPVWTYNARWDGALWNTQDVADDTASKLEVLDDRLRFVTITPSSYGDDWSDAEFNSSTNNIWYVDKTFARLFSASGGYVSFSKGGNVWITNTGLTRNVVLAVGTSDSYLDLDGYSAPSSPDLHRLYSDNIVKAWVCFDAGNGSATPTIINAYNIDDVTKSGSSLTVWFITDIGTTDYCAAYGGMIETSSGGSSGPWELTLRQKYTDRAQLSLINVATDTVSSAWYQGDVYWLIFFDSQ